PHGPRPLQAIRPFALEMAAYLLSRDVKMLVVACNAIEVAAIRDVTDAAVLPVVGVIDPGARAAVRATRNGRIGVIGTVATIASGAYDRAVATTGASVDLFSRPCPAFVDHVEAGDPEEFRSGAHHFLGPGVGKIDAVAVQPVRGGPWS